MPFGLKNCPEALDQKKEDIATKEKKKRFYFLAAGQAYNIYIYITDKDTKVYVPM